jgi:hypothetical protein
VTRRTRRTRDTKYKEGLPHKGPPCKSMQVHARHTEDTRTRGKKTKWEKTGRARPTNAGDLCQRRKRKRKTEKKRDDRGTSFFVSFRLGLTVTARRLILVSLLFFASSFRSCSVSARFSSVNSRFLFVHFRIHSFIHSTLVSCRLPFFFLFDTTLCSPAPRIGTVLCSLLHPSSFFALLHKISLVVIFILYRFLLYLHPCGLVSVSIT